MVLNSFEDIALEVARREGGKEEVNITQIRSVLSHLSDMEWEAEYHRQTLPIQDQGHYPSDILRLNGERRASNKKSKE